MLKRKRSYRISRPQTIPSQTSSEGLVSQSYYEHCGGHWTAVKSCNKSPSNLTSVRVMTWNIDFMVAQSHAIRMKSALAYLARLRDSFEADDAGSDCHKPLIICLQEMTSQTLEVIMQTRWVQEHFFLTDIDTTKWQSRYGTLTLADRRLTVTEVYRSLFTTSMGRDGLFINVNYSANDHSNTARLRLCNVHLESGSSRGEDPPLRASQLKAVSEVLHQEAVSAGITLGDFNPVDKYDEHLPSVNRLEDAYLWLDKDDGGGYDSDDEGHTWGHQPLNPKARRYPPKRMDKVLYCGAIRPTRFQRVGVGARVEDEHGKATTGMYDWITDHYGLCCEFELLEGGSRMMWEGQECRRANVPIRATPASSNGHSADVHANVAESDDTLLIALTLHPVISTRRNRACH